MVRAARLASVAAALIGATWLILWLAGIAPRWSAGGVLTVKANMALGLLLAGLALLALAPPGLASRWRKPGLAAATIVLLLGTLTLSEHLFDLDLGIDELIATETPGAAGTTSPNRMGPPGSLSLLLLGLGLLLLPTRRASLAPSFGLAVCIINLLPAVGFLYGIDTFYQRPLTGIAWSTVIAMLLLGSGLAIARPDQGPLRQVFRDDMGGALLRRLLPLLILLPLALGFLKVQGEQRGHFDTVTGTGAYTILMVLGFAYVLFRTAASLSRTARARDASQIRFQTLFENMNEAFALHELICDEAGRPVDYRFLEMNAAFEKHTGLRRAHILGKTVREVLPGVDPAWIETYGAVALSGTPVSFDRHEPATGRHYHVHAYQAGPRQFACVFMDITALTEARRQLEAHARELDQQVEQRTRELRELAGQLETFSYSIAHDLRSPLRSMRNFAQLLEEDYGPTLDDTARDYLRRITRAAGRMDALITDVLAYSRATRSDAPLADVDLDRLVAGIIEGDPQFQERAGAIEIVRPLPAVSGNPALLTQVISNLMGNALKFVAAGREPRVTVRAEPHGDRVRVWVEDQGIGIPAAQRDKVFQLFQRLHTPNEYPGTGLGLATAKIAVERMGGKIGFESEPGAGTRFWFELGRAAGNPAGTEGG